MQELPKHKSLNPYVRDILLIEDHNNQTEKEMPFYPDGYPGIVYSESKNAFYVQPQNRNLPDFYLYGQAIVPIVQRVKGSFKLITLRLYPFTVRMLLGINPKILNDECFDLMQLKNIDTKGVVEHLRKTVGIPEKLNGIVIYFNELVKLASRNTDNTIKLALNLIISTKGTTTIREIHDQLFITERTFERRFSKEVGVTPKQFSSIIQFSSSLNMLTDDDFGRLTDIGLDSGYADQSHFIRTFKKYTGKTPSTFLKSNRI